MWRVVERRLHTEHGMNETNASKQYVLVILKPRCRAFGPFASRDDVEYAAMDYYGTAITGASAEDAFLITELRPAKDALPEGAWNG
jgi:hypothetical protein